MKQIHKKALLLALLLAAAFVGTMLALYPVWEHRQEQKEQEALLLQLEQQINEEDTASIRLSVDEWSSFHPLGLTLWATLLTKKKMGFLL